MPRSFLLLKFTTLNAGCHIGMSPVNTQPDSMTWPEKIMRLKIAYNEMVQLWGSLAEGGLHAWGGGDKRAKTRSSGLFRWLRGHLLFDVGCADCG